jgi:hypothetical protein
VSQNRLSKGVTGKIVIPLELRVLFSVANEKATAMVAFGS